MSEMYTGSYRVLKEVSTLAQRRLPGRGDILRHKSGAIVLRCPKCVAIQFTRAEVLDSDDSPTLDRPVQCGAGHCKKCGIWFTIHSGRAAEVPKPEKKPQEIPKVLARAGVHPSPKLPDQ